MANTYTLISSNTLSSSQASVTFSAISSSYTDLILKVSARSDGTTAYPNDLLLKINSITSGYSITEVEGYGSTASSQRVASNRMYWLVNSGSQTANTFSNVEIYIPNYNVSQNHQISYVGGIPENGTTWPVDTAGAFLLSNTATITSLNLTTDGNFVSGSSFWLYGIKNS